MDAGEEFAPPRSGGIRNYCPLTPIAFPTEGVAGTSCSDLEPWPVALDQNCRISGMASLLLISPAAVNWFFLPFSCSRDCPV